MNIPHLPRRLSTVDARLVIGVSIVGLTLLVLALSVDMVWRVRMDYLANRQMIRSGEMADRLMEACVVVALERGVTSAALGKGRPAGSPAAAPIPSEGGDRLSRVRENVDQVWRGVVDVAKEAAKSSGDPYYVSSLEGAARAYGALRERRDLADRCISVGGDCEIDGRAWFDAASALIGALGELREAVLLPADLQHRRRNLDLALKRWAMVAGESAGRERGILAWYIAAGRPLPEPVMETIKLQRGVVLRAVEELVAFGRHPDVAPEVVSAIRSMESAFLDEFDRQRRAVLAAAAHGVYPVDADEWIGTATRAIDSLVAISAAASRVAESHALDAMRVESRQMLVRTVIAVVAMLFALLGLTRVRQTARELFREKEVAEVALHSIGDAVITTDAERRVEYLNPAAEQLTGWLQGEARRRPLDQVFRLVNGASHASEPNPVDCCLRERRVVGLAGDTVLVRRDGAQFVVETSAAPIMGCDGEVCGAVLVFYDTGQMRGVPHLLSYHATHDSMTSLVNRREFERRLTDLLIRTRGTPTCHALGYLDLDQFKLVNDTCGHAVGDRLLCQLTYLLKGKVRETDTLARLGGDEFGLLLVNCPLDRAVAIVNEMRETVKHFRFIWQERSFDIGVSIGLVPVGRDSVSAAEVLSEADAACALAKEKGRNRVQVHVPGDAEMARRHGEMLWVSTLRQALDEDRFHLYYQTISSLRGDGICHGEVLLRLKGEDGRLVPPLAFLPAAERYDLMPSLDRWVIRNALALLGRYLAAGGRPVMCNINLSGASLGGEDLQAYIEDQLVAHGVPAGMVCFEITESTAIANLERAAVFIQALKAKGACFALDDFGNGLSSFAYLKTLPVDYLKIDGMFVKDVARDPVARAMVQAIHAVACTMGIRTVAECVEDETTLAIIREIGVDYAQGYVLSEPQPMADCLNSRPAARG